MRIKSIFDCIQGLLFIVTAVFPVVFTFPEKTPWYFRLFFAVPIIIIYIILWVIRIKKEKNTDLVEVEEGTDEFFSYFRKFYSKSGKLSIFCSDLDWMIKNENNLVEEICNKGNKCAVYLKNKQINPIIKDSLEKKDVQIFFNNNLETKHRFSLIEDNNIEYLIISEKRDDNDNNKIIIKKESNQKNPYIITVVKDLLKCIERENNRINNDEQ